MAKQKIKLLIILLLLAGSVLFYTCTSKHYTGKIKNIATVYNPSMSSIHPEYKIVHVSDSISNLYFKIFPQELLFNSANTEGLIKANLKIHYRVYNTLVNQAYVDSATHIFSFTQYNINEDFISYFPIKVPIGGKYNIEIRTTDENRATSSLSFIYTVKENKFSSENFLITDAEHKVVFENYINIQSGINIKNLRLSGDKFHIAYFKPENYSPLPLFSLMKEKNNNYSADSSWVWTVGDTAYFIPEKEGTYFFRADSSSNEGMALQCFNRFYPKTRTANSLLKPLRYLMSSKEYSKIEAYGNKKLAVDSFWLAASGNIYRSKELIRVYYSRVYYANKYFTSFTEGWLTDRGMIYTVFGPPKTIYKSDNSERWIYGLNNNLSSMDFYFTRHEHPFCNNNFVLNRQDIYKSSWYQAVDTWRNGRVYSVLN